jgi:hypothetical protein
VLKTLLCSGKSYTTASEAVRPNISEVTDSIIVKMLVNSLPCMHTEVPSGADIYRLFQQPATSANNITKDTGQPMQCP